MKDFLRKLLGQKLINYYHFAGAVLANFIYSFPSCKLHVIGVTGTDGKTTTVNLIARILQAASLPVSFLSTINAQIGSKQYDTGLHTTTPSPFWLQRLLSQMVKAGSKYVVLEVTSHALDQYRVWGIKFEIAVITNVTHEHLDYHKTYQRYLEAKARLFKNVKISVLNRDDESFEDLHSLVSTSPPIPPQAWGGKGRGIISLGEGRVGERSLTYGLTPEAEIWADQIEEELIKTNFVTHTPTGEFTVKLNLPGQFNVANALAAITVGLNYNIPASVMTQALAKVKGIIGRTELFNEGQAFYAMVDFAHTPNALEKLLSFLRPKISGRIIVVFGAAGERDHTKRPLMGEAADKHADIIVVTREDNRSEDVMKISKQIAAGIKNKNLGESYYIIPDRREALRLALRQARKGDLVVITGKGHEQSLNIDGREVPWDDRKTMIEELKNLEPRISNTSPSFSPLEGKDKGSDRNLDS